MRKVLGTLLAVALCTAISLSAETYKEFDTKIEKQLTELDPAAVETWRAANLAREAGKHDEAQRLYADVFQRVPQFDHALRRQAGEEIILDRRDAAIAHARQALNLDRSAENLATLAAALIITTKGAPPAKDLQEGKALADEAVRMKPNDSYTHGVLAQAAIVSNDFEGLKRETARLEVLAPREVNTQMMRVTVAASEGEWSAAFDALDRARQLGLPAHEYNDVKKSLQSAMPIYLRWWRPSVLALAAWFGGFAVLLLVGAMLSRSNANIAADPITFGVSPTVVHPAARPGDVGNWPWWWIRPPQILSAAAGMHRFVWDLHYTPAPEKRPTFPISATPRDTAPDATSPWVMPGTYTVRLTADGREVTQPLVVKMDPRVKTPPEGLAQQFALTMQIYEDMLRVGQAIEEASSMADKAKSAKAGELVGEEGPRRRRTEAPAETLNSVAGGLRTLFDLLQSADVAPSAQVVAAVEERHRAAVEMLRKWQEFRGAKK